MIPVNESNMAVDIKSLGQWCVSSNHHESHQQQQHQLHHHQHYHHSLKMSKESHSIKKPTSSSSTSSSSPNSSGRSFPSPPPQAPKPRHPVIIYTNSPKIIHSDPQDFMALVQNLTGMSRSDDDDDDNHDNDDEKKSLEIKNKKTDNDNNVISRGVGENGYHRTSSSLNNVDSKMAVAVANGLRSSNEDSVQSSTGINTNDYEISSVFGDGQAINSAKCLSVFLEPQLSSNTRTSMPPFCAFNSTSSACDDYFIRDNNFPLK